MSSCPVAPPTSASQSALVRYVGAPTREQLRSLYWGFVVFTVAAVADTVSTAVLLSLGLMEEHNPLMRWVLGSWGFYGFLGVKVLLIIVPLYVLDRQKAARFRFVHAMTWVMAVGYVVLYTVFFLQANLTL